MDASPRQRALQKGVFKKGALAATASLCQSGDSNQPLEQEGLI